MNFVDVSKTISDELCNMGGGFQERGGGKSTGATFLMDVSPFRDERCKRSGGSYGQLSILFSMFPCTLQNSALSVFKSQNFAKEL